MPIPTPNDHVPDTGKKAFTLVEAVISILIIGVMLVAALGTVGASRLGQYKNSQQSRGKLLAQALMDEILQQDYKEPDSTPVFGREASEISTSRSNYDDVDDYHNWSASPPQNKDGTVISDSTGFMRSVSVQWVNPANLEEVSAIETGVKRITVTVTHAGLKTGSLVAIKTSVPDSLGG